MVCSKGLVTKVINFLKKATHHNEHVNSLIKLGECIKLREWIRTISDGIQ